jgi:hypothetical protein
VYEKAIKFSFKGQNIFWVLVFSFMYLVLVDAMDRSEVMKIQKYHVVFVYIFARQDGQDGKTKKENHATKVTKIPQTKYMG